MTHYLKPLGLALVTVLAMSSLVASAASATHDDIVTGQPNTRLTINQHNGNNKFTLAGQSVECTTAKVSATVSTTPASEVTTEVPTYTGCTYGGAAATVTMNGCGYLLTGETVNGDAAIHIECEAGKKIELTLNSLSCKVFIAAQAAEEGYTMTTIGGGTTQELTLHITAKVKVTSAGDAGEGVTCASLTNGTGTFCGTKLVTGETKDANPVHVGVWDNTL